MIQRSSHDNQSVQMSKTSPTLSQAETEAIELCRDLIRIDSTNSGDPTTTVGERKIAEYVAENLAEVGIEPMIVESAPGRASVVARMEGADPGRGGLLIHGHLDVVPADPTEWSVHPFSGEIRDGYLWGRGAIDMKDMDAMTLAVIRHWARSGRKPPRDVVLAFVADEEAGGHFGAQYLVTEHSQFFDGCTEAISEVGGFSVTVRDDLRLYLIQTAEKGMAWLRLIARGRPGHGSMVHDDNAVTALSQAVSRIGKHEFPLNMTPTVRAFLEAVSEAFEVKFDPDDVSDVISRLGSLSRVIGATLRDTANPTMLNAGYKANVIPSSASAVIDGRFLPGHEEKLEQELAKLVGSDFDWETIVKLPAVETTFDGPLVDVMSAALRAEDPGARPVPYMMSGGTDAKSFQSLGIRCFGFSPLLLPPELDFASLFHGIDERVPVEALRFGVRVLDRFLAGC